MVAGGHLRRLQRDGLNSCLSAAGWDEYEALTTDCFLGSSTIGSRDGALHADVDIYPNTRRSGPFFLPTGRERCLNRGIEYTAEQFNRQHRQLLFMVHLCVTAPVLSALTDREL